MLRRGAEVCFWVLEKVKLIEKIEPLQAKTIKDINTLYLFASYVHSSWLPGILSSQSGHQVWYHRASETKIKACAPSWPYLATCTQAWEAAQKCWVDGWTVVSSRNRVGWAIIQTLPLIITGYDLQYYADYWLCINISCVCCCVCSSLLQTQLFLEYQSLSLIHTLRLR